MADVSGQLAVRIDRRSRFAGAANLRLDAWIERRQVVERLPEGAMVKPSDEVDDVSAGLLVGLAFFVDLDVLRIGIARIRPDVFERVYVEGGDAVIPEGRMVEPRTGMARVVPTRTEHLFNWGAAQNLYLLLAVSFILCHPLKGFVDCTNKRG